MAKNDIISNLLSIVQTAFSLSDAQLDELKFFVQLSKSENPQALIPLHKIRSRQAFFSLMEEINECLERLYGREVDADVPYVGLNVPSDDVGRLRLLKSLQELPEDTLKKIKYLKISPNEYQMLVPANLLISLPIRNPEFSNYLIQMTGTPAQRILKDKGTVKARRKSREESEADYYNLCTKIDKLLNELLRSGKIANYEYKFANDLLTVICAFRIVYVRENNVVPAKRITTIMSNLEKAGMLSSQDDNKIERSLLNAENRICKICGESFDKTAKTQTFCKRCSNSKEYHRYRRKLKGAKPRGGKRPGAGRPKKIGS